ncbi:hypothetical protein IC582_019631 [Cucumis melo]
MCTHIEDVVYCSFHWMLHVIDLCKNCVYVLDSLRSKVNEDIHGVINCARQLDSVGCGYYVQKYIHEIVHNSSTSITSLCWILCIVGVYYWFAMEGRMCCLICVIIYFYMEVYAGILGIIVCITGELVIRH